jgi:small neutral amino acid transporter SnatA (MarC family)
MPLFAGPAAIATIVLRAAQFPDQRWMWLGAVMLTSAIATVILVFGDSILQRMGTKGINAMERLMGLILTILSVQMILDGISTFVDHMNKVG